MCGSFQPHGIDATSSAAIRSGIGAYLLSWRCHRAVIAVIALYALALQAILGGLMAAQTAGPVSIICLHDAGSSEDGSSKPQPAHGHLDCCTAAHTTVSLATPVLTSTEVVWPPREAVLISWRLEVVTAPRPPPGIVASARAPPVV